MGCAIGSVGAGLDASGRFIPQRLLLRASILLEGDSGRPSARLGKSLTLKPVRVEVERGVSLLLDPRDLVAREILIRGVWQPEVWRSISDGLSEVRCFWT